MKLKLGILGLLISWSGTLTADDNYQYQTLASNLEHPWSLAFLPDGQLLVTERAGRLWLLDADGERLAELTPDLRDLFISGQAGLFEVRLHPAFAENNYVYLTYACGQARANHTCLGRGRLQEQELLDWELLFRTRPAKTGAAHYGARLTFLPDQTLIMTMGDGFDYREQAQRPSSHLGSTLRLNADGSVPADNPSFSQASAQPETYTIGHRNPQGIAWHPEREELWSSEHGPKGGDEMNLLAPGENYGWPLLTGGVDYTGALISPHQSVPGMQEPRYEWTPSIAPAGLAVYQGDLFADWQGDLLVPALAGRQLVRLTFTNDDLRTAEVFNDLSDRLRAVEVHPQTGAVYLLTDHQDGALIRMTPKPQE